MHTLKGIIINFRNTMKKNTSLILSASVSRTILSSKKKPLKNAWKDQFWKIFCGISYKWILECVWTALGICDTQMLNGNTLFKVQKIESDGKSFVYRVCNQVFFSSVLDLCARQVWHGCKRKCDWSTQFHSWKNLMMATNIVNWTSSNIYGLTLISSADIEY